jgi:hypothetical protein
MIRSIVSGLLSVFSVVVVGSLPAACQSGGVGDPCTPEDEYDARFAGFKVTEENIESRSFQCQTRICLVNHFQGRVSCPLGQGAPVVCGPNAPPCPGGQECALSATFARECDPANGTNDCNGRPCNEKGRYCECASELDCPQEIDAAGLDRWFCNANPDIGAVNQCMSFVCHNPSPDACQKAGATDNEGKACCVPGTTDPVAAPVCGQCAADSNRNAEQAVYCSCRCGVATGEPEDPDFNFCECPDGFTCSEIRKDVGLGDKQITGKYCIKAGTEFKGEQLCGQVQGYFDSTLCKGL